ncbi:hypothetical protein EKO04_011609 [Ascochyta lentis]|uniref:Uncharacterized protein n=1 Tax=Ascochyta lentis TaxID=205686 RepID=A0A8H7IS44_9PLEO|nr:hypothetical protein EKO04_011609 [Ascochyta lentis]
MGETCAAKHSHGILQLDSILLWTSKVRLKPVSDSAYCWKIVPGKELLLQHLFSKNISEHSVGAYKELCAGVSKDFEVIAPTVESADAAQRAEGLGCLRPAMSMGVDMSFSAQIARLEEENTRLSTKAEEAKGQLSAESRRRQEVETTVEQLGQAHQRLQEQYDKDSLAAESYLRVLQKQGQGLLAVMQMLEELKQGLSVDSVVSRADVD